MKKALIIIPNLVIIGLILYFIVGYANSMEEESKRSAIEAYEKMTLTVDQIIANYRWTVWKKPFC